MSSQESGPLFREAFAIAGGPVTEADRDAGQCYWQCPNMNPEVRTSGDDAIIVYSRCNKLFGKIDADRPPECAIAYAKQGAQDA